MIKPGDVVVVPFPFAEGKGHKWRPAAVVSSASFHKKYGLCWVAMITSADNAAWPGDIPIAPLKATGLSASSCLRPAKLAAMQCDAAKVIGRITPTALSRTVAFMRAQLADNRNGD